MSQREIARSNGSLFADDGADGFLHRAFLRGEGFNHEAVRRRPVIGICTSWSELSPCNAGLRDVAVEVKKGIAQAGGIGLEFPTISLSEPFIRPTSMLLRNLMSMDVEEMIASSPIDGVVLLGGCDKTVPAQLMGAISAGKPAIMVTAGPRPVSCWRDAALTIDEVWPLIDERRLGRLDDDDWVELEGKLNVGVGTCNVLGTAVTMAAIAEVLGFALPGSSLHAAGSDEHLGAAVRAGAAIVDAVGRGAAPVSLVTEESLENAVRMVCALGGSTNALIHLEAIAGRAGVGLGIERIREWARTTPLLANVRPSGSQLLSDLQSAGGVPAVARELGELFHAGTATAEGLSWDVARARTAPVESAALRAADASPVGEAIAVLSGNLAPGGAVVKPVAGGLRHARGRAVVFDGVADLNRRIDDEGLDVDADSVLVLRGVGTRGAPGIPEVGHIPIPARLARAGVVDMLRVTDARMSGTATGTVVLHVTPEAAVGGPLALVRDGDIIEVDIEHGTIELLVPEVELAERDPGAPPDAPRRGYGLLYDRHVLQPDQGCDFDFLRAVPDE
ncbi:dihydroxy-acid dehydratase [Lysinimonas soli]|uniref:Dihydroxy-acid dehydratase n=1 Tax=Lysinimonas soli TaxID=1074233 RepID=A0ABW0NKB9_9MICO